MTTRRRVDVAGLASRAGIKSVSLASRLPDNIESKNMKFSDVTSANKFWKEFQKYRYPGHGDRPVKVKATGLYSLYAFYDMKDEAAVIKLAKSFDPKVVIS